MDDVKRYAVYDRHLSQGGGHEIEEDTDGDFVRHSDYAALQARLADLETKLGEVEAQLATARRDALEEALYLMPRYYGCWSSTGVHIGVWEDGATAAKVLEEYPQGVMRDLIDVEAIRALIAQEESKL